MKVFQNSSKTLCSLALLLVCSSGVSQAADTPVEGARSYYMQCGGTPANCPYINNGMGVSFCPQTYKTLSFSSALVHMNYVNQRFRPTLHCVYGPTGAVHTPQQLIRGADRGYPGNNWSNVNDSTSKP